MSIIDDAKMRLRRTMMFVPGNTPKMINNAALYGADTLMFDAEDAIAISQKDSARNLIKYALQCLPFPCETAVRINHITQTPYGIDDLKAILPSKPNLIRLPKTESVEEVQIATNMIEKTEIKENMKKGSINIICAIESVRGLYEVQKIAKEPRVIAIALGGEDFIADLRTQRTLGGIELYYARSEILMAARDAGIQAIDTVFADVYNTDGFKAEVTRSKDMGFDGKSVVHPLQIEIVHEIYTPSKEEIEHSLRVLTGYKDAIDNNRGVLAVDGKMIDGPIVVRARRIVDQAIAAGIIKRKDIQHEK
ncbi:HpcH/HpaI aldolase/citrate lyase family protein [Pectinatus cerevisiiphilus]|uniref:Citrate lyase subunit beta/citryl-CoA lyase n=1 Tax=Pectinatus cerevisiiphilus TaxID=86956 RepID=A0A4R3K6B5_9FIRM|nr:aldolase/citrate lyase family protein [Pectinatus cerevisiiphilus]TCS78221.1 citrate lyase subunit beta/citryl-CoA lyase [Pectinatus cerevisiiphilus]